MRGVLLHRTVGILVAAASNYHIGLLAEEGLTCIAWLLLVLDFVDHQSHLVILPKVETLDFWCLIERVGFGATHRVEIRCVLVAATRIKSVRMACIKHVKSILIWLDLLAVASWLACTGTDACDHLISTACHCRASTRVDE